MSRAMKASSSIWKMLSGATGAAKSFWSKATKWTTDDEGEVKREQTGNPENIQYLTDYQIEGRSNHDSNDITEYHSWAASSDESPDEEQTNSAQDLSTPDVSFEGQEFVYFVPNPEAPQFVKTDFLPSPPDPSIVGETGSQFHVEGQPSINVAYGDFVPIQGNNQVAEETHLGEVADVIKDTNGDAGNSQIITSFPSEPDSLTIREPKWLGWGEEDLLPPSELSLTKTWTGERRAGELPLEELVAHQLVALEDVEEEEAGRDLKEMRIQQLALQLLQDQAVSG